MSQTQQPEALRLAHDIGANIIKVQPTEAARLRFEAWMKGHCWKVCGQWDGTTYSGSNESPDYLDPQVMHTRQLFAAWRDCEALRDQIPAPAAQAVELPEPAVTLTGIDEYGPCLGWLKHWAEFAIGTKFYTEQQVRALRAAPAPAAVAVPDALLTDEQIEQAFISARDEFMLREVARRTDKQLRLNFGRAVLKAALAATPPGQTGIRFDFKQATELLGMFGGEPGEVSVIVGDGHSGHGLYAMWTADPEGTVYLGQTDDEAVPDTAPQAQDVQRDAAFEAVRKKFCKLQRYSFLLDDKGNVRRVPDFSGNWVEFEAGHTLFEPASVDAAIAASAAQEGGV